MKAVEVNEYDVKFARDAYYTAKADHSIPPVEVVRLLNIWISKQGQLNEQLVAQRPSRHARH